MQCTRIPLAEGVLAPVWNATQRDKALGDERPVLQRCGENAVFMGEDDGRCELSRFLGCLFADDSVDRLA